MKNNLTSEQLRAIKKAQKEIDKRIQEAGCTDDCDNCALEHCACESGIGAIIGDLGDIEFLHAVN